VTRNQQLARLFFALGIASLGILALVYGDLSMAWYSIPAWVPWREGVAYASGIILLGCGAGLLFKRSSGLSARILLPYLVIWLLLRVPALAAAPLTEVNWQNAGEYVRQTAGLVPAWLPFPTGWAYLTGAGHIAAAIGVLFSVYPRLAARMEAAMLSVFTLVVWVPAVLAAPTSLAQWTEFLISWAITAGAWVVAESITAKDSTKTESITPIT
jgi:uncharacterized membrane protein